MTTSIGLSALVATAMALQVAAPPPQEPRTARPLTLPLVQTVTSSPATQGATAQTPATPPALVRDADARLAAQRDGVLQLHVGGVTLREDGSQMGGAFTGGDDQFERYIYASATSCAYGTSADEPVAPRVAWRVRATVVERTADGVAAQIEWARLWSEGQRLADGPTGSSRVTMRSGARLLLDAVTFEPGGPCRATTMRLEAAVGSGPFTGSVAMGGFGGGRGGRGGSIVGRPSTGSGTGTSAGGATSVGGTGSSTASAGGGVARGRGGRGTSGSAGTGTGGAASAGTVGTGGTGATDATGATASATPPGTGGAGAGRGGGRGGAGAGRGAIALTPRVTDPFDLEIWLVHRRPDKSEGVQRVAMQGLPGGAAFEFPLVPAGGLNVDVRGRFTVVDTPAGQRELSLRFDRAVIGQQTWRSTGTRAIAMPSPDDVVSFELPPPFGTERAALDGHLFSLRIRIRPAK